MPPKSRAKRAFEAPFAVEPDEKRVKVEPQTPRKRAKKLDSTPSKSNSTGPAADAKIF
jgi:hypothetical protein